jgi:hypothetical protein
MSVIYRRDLDCWPRDRQALDVRCASCTELIAPPAVFWCGLDMLFWHPRCAARLGAHLIADAREADLAAAAPSQWRHRLVTAVRHRLEREEAVA